MLRKCFDLKNFKAGNQIENHWKIADKRRSDSYVTFPMIHCGPNIFLQSNMKLLLMSTHPALPSHNLIG